MMMNGNETEKNNTAWLQFLLKREIISKKNVIKWLNDWLSECTCIYTYVRTAKIALEYHRVHSTQTLTDNERRSRRELYLTKNDGQNFYETVVVVIFFTVLSTLSLSLSLKLLFHQAKMMLNVKFHWIWIEFPFWHLTVDHAFCCCFVLPVCAGLFFAPPNYLVANDRHYLMERSIWMRYN